MIGSDGTVQMEVEQLIEDVLGEVKLMAMNSRLSVSVKPPLTLSVRDRDVIVSWWLQENSQKLAMVAWKALGDLH